MNAEIRVYPDKELKAIDMAEIVDSLQLADGIIQGCGVEITQNGTALHIDDGRILIHGRLGVVTAGNVELPALEATATCHLAAVCDLAVANPFYIALLSSADLDALEQKKSRVTYFNAGNGVDYVVLGTAVVNPTTHIVSDWTPQEADPVSNSIVFGDLQKSIDDNVAKINQTASAQHALLTQKINAWATYLQNRTSASARFGVITFTVPSFTIPAGQRVACSFPAIWGTTFKATGTNSRTEIRPPWVDFTQTYTTLSDGTKIPLNIDTEHVRYIAIGISGIVFTNAAYGGKGKNASRCVASGFSISGGDYNRRVYIYPQNIGTAEAIIDIGCTVLFVRRG
jgi:hypothetical protein